MAIVLPSIVTLSGLIPLIAVFVISVIFSTCYVRFFQNKRESEKGTTAIIITAFAVSLITSLLLPVDIFLVSFMKDNGTFKEWASNKTDRDNVEEAVLYTYYVFYSIILLFLFLILPLTYFFYEEKDETIDDETPTTQMRLCTSLKYTSVFLLLATVLLLMGAFIPFKSLPSRNSTDWERMQYLINEFSNNRGEDALSFLLNVLIILGMISMVVYTASGLSIWPIEMIKGKRRAISEYESIVDEASRTDAQILEIKEKYRNSTKKMTNRDARLLANLEEQKSTNQRKEHFLKEARQSCMEKCRPFIRPFQIILGILGGVIGFVLWLSLLLTNIDKAVNSLGYHTGYILPNSTLPNPLDFILVQSIKVFPIDYILFLILMCYLVACTISGIQQLGIWFFFLRMYRIRVSKTQPQALIMLCALLMYTILALNILLYSTSPQYSTFGSQTTFVEGINGTIHMVPCTIGSSNSTSEDCVMTQGSTLLLQFFYKAWIFGLVYYWGTWIFIGVCVIAFIVSVIRSKQSSIEGYVDRDDFNDSDDDLVRI